MLNLELQTCNVSIHTLRDFVGWISACAIHHSKPLNGRLFSPHLAQHTRGKTGALGWLALADGATVAYPLGGLRPLQLCWNEGGVTAIRKE
jgi:hypothetical protein